MDIFDTVQAGHYRQHDGLFIQSRQLSWVVSMLLVIAFFIFWSGYKTGKEVSRSYPHSVIPQKEAQVHEEPTVSFDETIPVPSDEIVTPGVKKLPAEKFYAQLGLYETKPEADALVASLRSINSVAYVHEHVVLNKTGGEHVWYQVVSDYFDNRADLEEYIALISQEESVQDVCFISC